MHIYSLKWRIVVKCTLTIVPWFFCDNNVGLRTGERASVTDRFQQAAEH